MPKMKTRKSIAKKMKRTAGGSLKRSKVNRSHLAANKTVKSRRQSRKATLVHSSDQKRIKDAIPYL